MHTGDHMFEVLMLDFLCLLGKVEIYRQDSYGFNIFFERKRSLQHNQCNVIIESASTKILMHNQPNNIPDLFCTIRRREFVVPSYSLYFSD